MSPKERPSETIADPKPPYFLILGCHSVKSLSVLLAVLLAIGTTSYWYFDKPLARWSETLTSPVSDFWQLVTRLGLSEWYIAISAALLIVFKLITRDQMLAWRSALVLLCVAGSGLFVDLLKWIFGRYRPPMLLVEGKFGFTFFHGGYMHVSFPSGHSATAAALVVVACVLMPRGRWLWVIMGLMIAASRIFVDAHYLSDVIAGWTCGTLLSLWICQKLKAPVIETVQPGRD